MDNRNEYIKELEQVISDFLIPLKRMPFPIVIKALTGYNVLSFDPSLERNKILLKQLGRAARIAGKKAYKVGIFTARPNEAGNRIESFVIEALERVGLKANKPVAESGKRKTAGYPDIQIEDRWSRTIYLDCKTYNTSTKNQTFRTFYFSPSKDPKITENAFHLLMSFELATGKRKRKTAFIPISWQIYTLDKLKVQVKHEFNASNKDLYTKNALLAKGIIQE